MAVQPDLVEMNIGSGKVIVFAVPHKIVDYFGIAISAAGPIGYLRKKESHNRKVREKGALNDTVVKTIFVETAEWYDVKGGGSGKIAGKLIKIPTELHVNANDPLSPIRFVSLRIPSVATNYSIAQWMKVKFTTKKPSYYIANSGRRYPVNVTTQADPNPGNNDPAPNTNP